MVEIIISTVLKRVNYPSDGQLVGSVTVKLVSRPKVFDSAKCQ